MPKRPPEYRPGQRRNPLADALWSLVAIVVAMIFLFPLYWGLSTSLRNPLDTFTVSGLGIPWINFQPTLDNWTSQLASAEAQRALANSTIIAVCATLLAIALGAPAAYGLARFQFSVRGLTNKDLTVWFLSQRVLPPVATVIPFYLVMRTLGLLDTKLALVLINATFILPFVVVILRQTFLDLPVELEEAALVDGASHFTAFFNIALPLAAPAMAATGLIIFAFAWNEFLFAITIGSQQALTIPVHMAGAVDTRGVQFWFMATRALIAMIPPVLLALLAQRYIVRGLTLGAVKG
ncbi:MAG: carbohydrate ABC transporter permease [Dongiaceae bacterium]